MLAAALDTGKMGSIRSTNSSAVICVLLNWNNWRDTVDCLDALKECTYSRISIVVVDNASTNDSVEQIRSAHPGVLVMTSATNLGFAGGNNIGIRYAIAQGARYCWLLNNDTKPAADALENLVAKADADDRTGAVASICYYADLPSTVQVWAGARVNLWVGYARNTTMPQADAWFDALYGASLLISCRAFQDAGLLDEGFFFYLEETEFCLRLRKRGWRLYAAPDSRVLHKVSGSTGPNKPVLDRYFTASGLRILALHSPIPSLSMVLFLLVRLTRRLVRFRFDLCRSIYAGVQDYRKMLPISPRVK